MRGSVNVPGAFGRERIEAEKALEARIASAEKTLNGMEKIPGSVPPTPQVTAQVGQIYINVITGEQWKCVAVSDSGSAWEKITGSGKALSAADVGAVPVEEKAKPGGVATLDETGKLTAAQKPGYTAADVGAVPITDKAKPGGVATLDETGKVPETQLPSLCPFVAGTSAPSDTKKLWIDTTANTGGLKYWNGSAWVIVPVAYT